MTSPFLTNRVPICPLDLLARAKAMPSPRVVIARAGSALPMQAAFEAVKAGIMVPVFTGEADAIHREAAALNWDIGGFDLIEADGEEDAGAKAAALCGSGAADVLMKGQLHTDIFLKSALNRQAGLRTGNRLVHVFHVSPPDGGKSMLISDAAVNVAPDINTRKDAIRAVVNILHALGNARPKIAILSATENPIPSIPSAVEGRQLADWAAENITDAQVSGPLALDLILSPDAVRIKGLTDDPVAGDADAVIVPDIVSGNAFFKSLVYVGGGCAAGVGVGAKVPLLLTSRADPPAARLASIALSAVIAGQAQ